MSIGVAWKVFADVCLCFGIMGTFPKLFAYSFFPVLPAAFCGLGAGMAVFFNNRGWARLRYLGLIPIVMIAVFPQNTSDWITLAPAICYGAAVIIRGELTLEYYGFRQFFKNSAIALCVFYFVICGLAYMESVTDPTRGSFQTNSLLMLGGLYLMAGVILLRQLRLGAEEQRNGRILSGIQMAVMLSATSAVVALVIWMKESFWESVASVLGKVVALLMMPLWLLLELFDGDVKEFLDEKATGVTGNLSCPSNTATMPSIGDGIIEQPAPEPESDFPWILLLALICVVIVMVLLTRSFHIQRTKRVTSEKRSKLESSGNDFIDSPGSNREKIRKIYRDFLRNQRKQGVKLQKNQTSSDILGKVSIDTDREAAAVLRRLYVTARYDLKTQITDKDVKLAKAVLKKCKKN